MDKTETTGVTRYEGTSPPQLAPPRNVASQIVEKLLVNLGVLSQIREGEKVEFTPAGYFVPQRPGRLTSLMRLFWRVDRWDTMSKISEAIATAEIMEYHDGAVDRDRIEAAMRKSVHGLRNLQRTYTDDTLFVQNLEVMLERVGKRYRLADTEML
jgi:hypothetical protein